MKKVFRIAVLAVFVFMAVFNVYKMQVDVKLSDNQLKNVEALAVDKDYTSPYSCVRGGYFCNLYLNGEEVFSSTEFRAQY